MVMSVTTNISSLNAQNNLAKTQSKLSTAIERLSSGMRINSAKDDAAGLAISTRFTTQINGLNQAIRNANDGISLAQTTESALNEVTNNLQRIRELSVQAANATNSDSDRSALDAEVQQRLAEITRISQQTTFNGRHVLDGTFGTAAFQVGANVGQTISVNLSQGTGSSQVGQTAASSTGDISSLFKDGKVTLASGDLKFTTGASGSTTDTEITGTFNDVNSLAAAINAQSATTKISATVTNGELKLANGDAANDATIVDGKGLVGATTIAKSASVTTTGATDGFSKGLTLAAGDLTIQGVDMAGTYKDAQSFVDTLNAKGVDGLSAFYDSTTNSIHLNSQKDLVVDGTKSGTGTGNLGFSGAGGSAIAIGGSLEDSSVKTVSGANDTISRVDAALSSISSMRSDLGAIQNRFDSTISNLQTISQNLDSSRSQIQDADFAQETANMSSANILQQAGVSVLAQANSSTQAVLKLLQ
ncbi:MULTISPECIES: flagellin [Dyella]|uniref:Flagellin n=2 Tax=Dyella TaxID=231454 RepID=A0A4R0YH88_9GAMM|nr:MULTISPECIES: flagellin [Dyella]TBR37191.1 flagellin [Dyella terrae]TCI07719.1 flagellin [Dyella soli]